MKTAALAPQRTRRPQASPADGVIAVVGVELVADVAGALYWPEQGLLAVADLHFEKGSAFAERGVLLPPYDTAATLARLTQVIARHAPRVVVSLGDSFHDGGGAARPVTPRPATPRGAPEKQRGRLTLVTALRADEVRERSVASFRRRTQRLKGHASN